jgi:hypothetical protein
VLTLVAALILGQAAQSLLYTISIATGQFDARVAGYGYPLDALQQADARLGQLQRQAGATAIFIAEGSLVSVPMNYALIREHPDRVGFVDTCLVLPPPDAGPALLVISSDSRNVHALATLPAATLLTEIPMAGNAPLAVYRVAGAPTGALPGETSLAPVRLADASGQGIQLDAGLADGKQIRLRWTVLGSTPTGAVPLTLRTQVRDVNAAGQVSPVRAFRDCAPTRWQAGDTVFTWLPFPSSWSSTAQGAPDTVLIQGEESTTALDMPTFGAIRLLSSAQASTAWHALAPQSRANSLSGGGQAAYDGVLLSERNVSFAGG